jgi:hypothetical protein
MSYRIWWLIAFFALGIGIAIELETPSGSEAGPPAAEARAPAAALPHAGGLPAAPAPAQARLSPFARHGAG